MAYLTTDEIRNRVEQDQEDYYSDEPNPTTKFDSLLTTLEKETRAIIESYKGDVTFASETKTETFIAPDKSSIDLLYPVNTVNSVKYRSDPSEDWNTLDSDHYNVFPRKVILSRFYNRGMRYRRYSTVSPVTMRQKKASWRSFCTEVKIDYDRGYSTIPSNVTNIQITMINKALRQLRNEQNITALQPEEINTHVDFDELLTEDLMKRLDSMTAFRNTITVA